MVKSEIMNINKFIGDTFFEIVKTEKLDISKSEWKLNCKARKPHLCPDEEVAVVEVQGKSFEYSENYFEINNRKTFNVNDSKLKLILLLVESPHKSEFGKTIHPCVDCSNTIRDNFLSNLCKSAYINDQQQEGVYVQDHSIIPFGKYRLVIMNLVPYQCSLGQDLNDSKNREMKNELFLSVFKKCCKEIMDKIKIYSPDIIINCCTKEAGQSIVQEKINETFPNTIKLEGNHPSSAYFCQGFWKAK